MRIKIFPPMGKKLSNVDERGWIEAEEGATLRDVLKKAGIPPAAARIFMVRVNSEPQPMDTVLHDGDMIGFFSMITGG